MRFAVTADIDADPQAVWSVLSRPGDFPSWDSGVARVEGTSGQVAVGQKLKIEVAANPGRAFPVKVVEVSPPNRMVFEGGMPLGLFVGRRTYALDDLADGGTRFTMEEVYSGPLSALITRSIPDLQPSFDHFATGLKATVEAGRR